MTGPSERGPLASAGSAVLCTIPAPARTAIRFDIRERLVRWYGEACVAFCEERGILVCVLERDERYDEASPALRTMGIDVNAWPAVPAGLFVVRERTVYLRKTDALTLAHEFAHGLDCALGGGTYMSSRSFAWYRAFRDAQAFVTPYAASALDEYFAESVRAYVGANTPNPIWPIVSRERLQACSAETFRLIDALFSGFNFKRTHGRVSQ